MLSVSKAMEKLATKFDQELKHGTMIYSFSFSIPEWEPIETCLADSLFKAVACL